MSEPKQIIDVIINRIDTLDNTITEKLENYNKEFLNFKYDIRTDLDKINLKLEHHDSEIKNINDRINLPWQKRILEIFAESSIKSVGAILGICIFVILIGSFGGDISNLLKTLFSAIVGI